MSKEQKYVPHLFDLIYAISNVKNMVNISLPAMYLEAASVDSSRLLGSGASFEASVRALPAGPETLESYTDMGTWTVKTIRKAPPRPRYVVYKTARVAFDDQGEPAKGTTSALRSVLTELHSLIYPPLFNHPNIVSFLGLAWGTNSFDARQRLPALVVEYADHGSLADVFGTQRLTSDVRQALCFDAASGLEAIHAAGLIHGDIKADNVLVCSGTDRVIAKLADFGFSVVEEAETAHSSIGGTWPWKAPEADSPVPVSELKFTDIYSLGLMIWVTALQGQDPFSLVMGDSTDLQSDPTEAQVDYLKRSNKLLSASKVSLWYPKYCLRSLVNSPGALQQLDGTAASTLRQFLQIDQTRAVLSISQWSKDQVEQDAFLSKLDKIFLNTLPVEAHSRSLARAVSELSEGIIPAHPHITRMPQDQMRKYEITNNSETTKTFRMTKARKQDDPGVADVPSGSQSGQAANPDILCRTIIQQNATENARGVSGGSQAALISAQFESGEGTGDQRVLPASIKIQDTKPSADGIRAAPSWVQRGFKVC